MYYLLFVIKFYYFLYIIQIVNYCNIAFNKKSRPKIFKNKNKI